MADNSILEGFREIDRAGLPTFEALENERAQVLWVLAVGDRGDRTRALTAANISEILREEFGHVVSRQQIAAILASERRTIHATRGSPRSYRIMAPGLQEVQTTPSSVTFIRPEEALTSIRSVQEVFGLCKGQICVCDPYVDSKTIDLLVDFKQATQIRLLTQNVTGAQSFKRDLEALAKENGISVEARVVPYKVLHDRYVIHDDGLLLIGTSLNYLGRKQSFVVSLGDDIRESVSSTFENYWTKSSPL